MEERLLEIKDLHVEYVTDEARVFAVNGLDLTVNRGETVGLVGETGAGKTTTALSVMRLLPDLVGRITRGSIILDGIDITRATEADMRLIRGEAVSMIFQDPMTSLNPVMTIGEQIAEVLHLHEKYDTKEEVEHRVDEILRLVGLPPERKGEYPHQFSGGMKQRVVIAIALACEPKLLLADEPTTALDVTIQAQVLQMVRELKEKLNTAMLLITHDLGVVAQTCDRVGIMYAGEIVELGTAEQIFQKDERHHPYTVGLFGSIPDLTRKTRRLSPIEGLMPDPTDLPPGCRFHTRCPHRMPVCEVESPRPSYNGGHLIRCHIWDDRRCSQ
ncbi:MAG: ABC transporter ATP-binding protein [Bacillota bacterium]|jgi:peptide/nickel transport system ATP-binding protein